MPVVWRQEATADVHTYNYLILPNTCHLLLNWNISLPVSENFEVLIVNDLGRKMSLSPSCAAIRLAADGMCSSLDVLCMLYCESETVSNTFVGPINTKTK